MKPEEFHLGSCTLAEEEHVFLSVTPGFEHGPGIHRDGLAAPQMRDPHGIEEVVRRVAATAGQHYDDGWPRPDGPSMTTNAYEQRAGTWTVYHHLKRFHETHTDWRIVGAQSNGDLTMNPWHVAFLNNSYLGPGRVICGLQLADDDPEDITSRVYRCLVKWTERAARVRPARYEFVDLQILPDAVKVHYPADLEEYEQSFLGLKEYKTTTKDFGELIEFALAGKPIIERRQELSLVNAVDRFQDVRHVFNIPTVPMEGGRSIQFGEYQLFHQLNERRAALFAPVLIDLSIPERPDVNVDWPYVRDALIEKRYEWLRTGAPTRRGQFRLYPGDLSRRRAEVFFQPAVYPFGAIGLASRKDALEIVSLSCGGLSGRIGQTIESISRMMFDYFRCTDAMILDEGFDLTLIANQPDVRSEVLLHKVWSFTKERLATDHGESKEKLRDFPLNRHLVADIDDDYKEAVDWKDVFVVWPHRAQIRSMLIFARKESKKE